MSDFKAKMHQIRFQLGLRLRPRWGAYSAPQTSWLYLRGLLLRGGRERGRGREWGKDREGDGKGGKGGDGKGIGGREGGEGMGACTHWNFRKSAPMSAAIDRPTLFYSGIQ